MAAKLRPNIAPMRFTNEGSMDENLCPVRSVREEGAQRRYHALHASTEAKLVSADAGPMVVRRSTGILRLHLKFKDKRRGHPWPRMMESLSHHY